MYNDISNDAHILNKPVNGGLNDKMIGSYALKLKIQYSISLINLIIAYQFELRRLYSPVYRIESYISTHMLIKKQCIPHKLDTNIIITYLFYQIKRTKMQFYHYSNRY